MYCTCQHAGQGSYGNKGSSGLRKWEEKGWEIGQKKRQTDKTAPKFKISNIFSAKSPGFTVTIKNLDASKTKAT